jgi:hypothetical protein
MLGRVRDEVVRATGRQKPFTYGSLGGEEVFLNAAVEAAGVVASEPKFLGCLGVLSWSGRPDSKGRPVVPSIPYRFWGGRFLHFHPK